MGTSRAGVIEFDEVGSDVNQTMLNTEEHKESVSAWPMLKRLPSKTLDHVGDTSWCSHCVVTVGETGCSALHWFQVVNIGITCFFHALTFAGSRGRCLNSRPIGRVFKHLPRDPVSVNAMKQTCVIVILAYFTLFQPNSH